MLVCLTCQLRAACISHRNGHPLRYRMRLRIRRLDEPPHCNAPRCTTFTVVVADRQGEDNRWSWTSVSRSHGVVEIMSAVAKSERLLSGPAHEPRATAEAKLATARNARTLSWDLLLNRSPLVLPTEAHRPRSHGSRSILARPLDTRAPVSHSKDVGRDRTAHRSLGGTSKAVLDKVISATALVLALPLMAMVAILIRAGDGGPAIYGHSRVGANGRPFRCYKFRTMVCNGDEILKAHLAACPDSAREWAATHKLTNDPRVTPMGRLLRRSSLDELPQLFNVLRGDMSCVGPRPVVAEELVRYGENAVDYLAARPGITGLWQISGRSSLDYADRVKLDALYVRRWTLGLDLVILIKTIPAVLRTQDAC